ncbi:MAG: DUF5678 domain-containing protein [Blastocatellia bacterium]
MSSITVENILELVNQLPSFERDRLIVELTKERQSKPETFRSKIISVSDSYDDRKLEYEWLAKHRREYVGQWIALKGDQLVAHGPNAKEVFTKADDQGIHDAMVLLVTAPDTSLADPSIKIPPSKRVNPVIVAGDRAREYEWLAKHRREYIGQWIALDGDRLVAHSFDAKEMFAQVDAAGVVQPLVLYVENPDVPFIGI